MNSSEVDAVVGETANEPDRDAPVDEGQTRPP
jgi:hypothetical protein